MWAQGTPTKYIETLNVAWLESSKPDFLEGHVFSEVYIDGYWYIIDPEGAVIKSWYGKRFDILAEGLDFADVGLNNLEDLKKAFENYKNKKIVA